MSQYKSKPAVVNLPPREIAVRFEDLSGLAQHVDKIPAEERAKIGELGFERDSIIIKNPQIGEMRFNVVERSDNRVVFQANGMLPLRLIADLKGIDDDSKTEVTTIVDIEIPAIARPFIGGKIQQVADAFGDMMAKLANKDGF